MNRKGIKIKKDYIPRSKRQVQKPLTQICPQCQMEIPVNEIQEHIKIELLDPKWKRQKDREVEKKRDSVLLNNIEVAKNLERLVGSSSTASAQTTSTAKKPTGLIEKELEYLRQKEKFAVGEKRESEQLAQLVQEAKKRKI
jgi:splicing factor 3A subunit 1